MSIEIKAKIERALKSLTDTEKIAVLESLCKKYRKINSANIYGQQPFRPKAEGDRPDLITLKNEGDGR